VIGAVVALAVVLLAYTWVGRRLVGWPPQGLDWVMWGLLAGHLVSLPVSYWLRPWESALGHGLAWFAYVGMGWLSLVVVGLLLTELGAGVWRIGQSLGGVGVDPGRRALLSDVLRFGIIGIAAGLTVAGIGVARRLPRVVEVDVPIAGLAPGLVGFRIAQLSDIHVGPTIKGDFLADLVEVVNTLDADLVAVTGDLVDGKVATLGRHVASLSDLRSRHGSFFVTGNHEYYSGVEEWMAELRRLGVAVLHNDHVVLEHEGARLALAGVPDRSAGRFLEGHRPDIARALAGTEDADARVLLAHQPVQIRQAKGLPLDLQLSGHTHGGQYFPFTLLIRLAQPFVAGLHRVGESWLYVSPGSGYWGPPLRAGMPAEITLLTLRAV